MPGIGREKEGSVDPAEEGREVAAVVRRGGVSARPITEEDLANCVKKVRRNLLAGHYQLPS